MRRSLGVTVVAAALGACAIAPTGDVVLPQALVWKKRLAGDVQTIADCVYAALSVAGGGGGLKQANLVSRKTVQIAQAIYDTKMWELTFAGLGSGEIEVSYVAASSVITGKAGSAYDQAIETAIEDCSAAGAPAARAVKSRKPGS